MKTMAFSEARSHFKQIVDAATRGEVIKITRNGKPVVEIHPSLEAEMEYWKKAKPLNFAKGGLKLLLEDRRRSR